MFLMPDLSHWQGSHTAADMARAAEVADAIMFKATEGAGFVDPEFVDNAKAANAAPANPVLPWGAYHFTRPGSAVAQGQHFLEVVRRVPGCRFLLLDWEDGDRDMVRTMLGWLRDHAGMPVGDYIGSHARSKGGQLDGADFHMVPEYGPAMVADAFKTDPLSAWQYTNGQVNGTDWPSIIPGIGPCDVSAVFRPQDFGLGDDMALLQEDIDKIAAAVWNFGIGPTGKVEEARDRLRQIDANTGLLLTRLAAVAAGLDELPAAIVAKLPPPSAGGLTLDDVQMACKAAVRQLLGSLDDPVVTA